MDMQPQYRRPATLQDALGQLLKAGPKAGLGLPEPVVTAWVAGQLSAVEEEQLNRVLALDDVAYRQYQDALAALPTPAQVHLVKQDRATPSIVERWAAARQRYGAEFIESLAAEQRPVWYGQAPFRPEALAALDDDLDGFLFRIEPRPGFFVELSADGDLFSVDAVTDDPEQEGQELIVVLCGARQMELELTWGPLPSYVRQSIAERRALMGEPIAADQLTGAFASERLTRAEVTECIGRAPAVMLLEPNPDT